MVGNCASHSTTDFGNPVENIWQFIRDNWLSNRVFTSDQDILDHCCYAWNNLIERPWKIMSIGMRQWAHQ